MPRVERGATDAVAELIRDWNEVQTSPALRAELQAFARVHDGLSDAQEAEAFEVVAAYWRRTARSMAKRNKQLDKATRK